MKNWVVIIGVGALLSVQVSANDHSGECPGGARRCSPGNSGNMGAIEVRKEFACELLKAGAGDTLGGERIAKQAVVTSGSGESTMETLAAGPITVIVRTRYSGIEYIEIRHAELEAATFSEGNVISAADSSPTAHLIETRTGVRFTATCFVPLIISPFPR